MRLNPESIIFDREGTNLKNNFYLISGNEETLIFSIQKKLTDVFKKRGYEEVIALEGEKIIGKSVSDLNPSLFSNSKIIIHKNPKDFDFQYFEGVRSSNTVVIIVYTSLKNPNKIKKEFETRSDCTSVSCYDITKDFKKRLLDNFMRENKIKIDSEGYWFLLENSPNSYALFANELEKIKNYGVHELSIKNIRLLLSGVVDNRDFDTLFFLCTSSKNLTVKKTRDILQSSADAYLLLLRIKFYLDLLSKKVVEPEKASLLPPYLFKHKASFANIIKNINKEKVIKMFYLVSKTELLLRKNNSVYFIIMQRCLLNLGSALR